MQIGLDGERVRPGSGEIADLRRRVDAAGDQARGEVDIGAGWPVHMRMSPWDTWLSGRAFAAHATGGLLKTAASIFLRCKSPCCFCRGHATRSGRVQP